MNRSQVKWLLVSIGFSVLVLGVVLYFTVDDTTVDYIRRINPFYLLAAVVLHLLSLVFWSLRIQKMSGSLGFRVRFTHCMNLVLANMLVAAVTPSQAGGEPVRIHELYRAGVPVGDATAVVIMERVLDGIVLGALGVFSVLFLGKYWRSLTTGFSGMGVLIGVACAVTTLIVIFFVYSVRNPDCLKRALRWGSRWVDRRWHLKRLEHLLEAIDREVDNFNQALTRFIGHGKGGLFIVPPHGPWPAAALHRVVHRPDPRCHHHDDPAHPREFGYCGTQRHVVLQPLCSLLDRGYLRPPLAADTLLPQHHPGLTPGFRDCPARGYRPGQKTSPMIDVKV